MQGLVLFSDDGQMLIVIMPSLDDAGIMLMSINIDGVVLPPVPIPVDALKQALGVQDAKS